ncbi:hypothetical protein GCM10027569_36010 [Flindersiella endophytica]
MRSTLAVTATAALALLSAALMPAAAMAGPNPGPDGVSPANPDTQTSEPANAPAPKPAPIAAAVSKELAKDKATDFWVVFNQRADLSQAAAVKDWNKRGQAVVDTLKQAATASQQGAVEKLQQAGADFDTYWISNRIIVHDGDAKLAGTMATVNGVKEIAAPTKMDLVEPVRGKYDIDKQADAAADAIEWNVQAINADDVWDQYGDRGEGITVASIDTGTDFRHPALIGSYRGNNGDGTFDHNYNWFDPAGFCDDEPCGDSHWHGTHTMGTMTGDDGQGNQIGVAPGAKWITAAGCCPSDQALLDSAEWILAPTDLDNQNPRADLRPNIVNNSWGAANGSVEDPEFDDVSRAWTASGIFGVYSNGNSGPGCDSAGSPGDSIYTYSVGAFQQSGAISSFSSRGPGGNGMVKPNISAPGEGVRSALPGGQYGLADGTSMAAPHVAAAVALIWSASPALVGDIEGTRALLNETAVDQNNTTCGGTAENNNVWGEGKLDALAAVQAAPRGDVGVLAGTVTDSASGAALQGAQLTITGPNSRTVTTGTTGTYSVNLTVGTYTVTARKYGYETGTSTFTVTVGETANGNIALTAVASYPAYGEVTDSAGNPVAGATVTIEGTPLAPVTTAADGTYGFDAVPLGTYTFRVASPGGCLAGANKSVTIDGRKIVNFRLGNRSDTYGYTCSIATTGYAEADSALALTGDDASQAVDLPFRAWLYGQAYTRANVSTNGHLSFTAASTSYSNTAIPTTAAPNAAIYAFWDDLNVDDSAKVYTKTVGTAPNRTFIIEWRNVLIYGTSNRIDAEIKLSENSDVEVAYRNIDPANARETGSSATVGVENAAGTDAMQYAFNATSLRNGAVKFSLPANGFLLGTVTDKNDGQPVAGATVTVKQGSGTPKTLQTAADGTYMAQVWTGDYDVDAAATNYVSAAAVSKAVGAGKFVATDFALATPRASVASPELSWVLPQGNQQVKKFTVTNTGSAVLDWSSVELESDQPWLSLSLLGAKLPVGGKSEITVGIDTTGVPAGVHDAKIAIDSNSGRTPRVEVPVQVVVSAYWKGVDAGAAGESLDAAGLPWTTDQAYAEGSYGFVDSVGDATTRSVGTNVDIKNTSDDALFRSQRIGMDAYRFDDLPAGTYEVTLGFAELGISPRVDWRRFDVDINGSYVLVGYDIAQKVGGRSADSYTYRVEVPEGGDLAVNFSDRRGYQPSVVNSIRVVQRPDL